MSKSRLLFIRILWFRSCWMFGSTRESSRMVRRSWNRLLFLLFGSFVVWPRLLLILNLMVMSSLAGASYLCRPFHQDERDVVIVFAFVCACSFVSFLFNVSFSTRIAHVGSTCFLVGRGSGRGQSHGVEGPAGGVVHWEWKGPIAWRRQEGGTRCAAGRRGFG